MTILQNHFIDLKNQAEKSGLPCFTDFLGLAEQNELNMVFHKNDYNSYGGYDTAERIIACFGAGEEEFPISYIQISPKNQKFADKLSHRDFLGALINLGIERNVLGDIVIKDNVGYLICLNTISKYICENLTKVKHTSVECKIVETIPTDILPAGECKEYISSSLRLDAVISSVYKMSRNDSKKLFLKDLVFVNGVNKEATYLLKENDIISVRGYGRIEYLATLRQTGKGRLVVQIKKS